MSTSESILGIHVYVCVFTHVSVCMHVYVFVFSKVSSVMNADEAVSGKGLELHQPSERRQAMARKLSRPSGLLFNTGKEAVGLFWYLIFFLKWS